MWGGKSVYLFRLINLYNILSLGNIGNWESSRILQSFSMEKRKKCLFNHGLNLIQPCRKLHVLDSLPNLLTADLDAHLLQPIVLQLFEDQKYLKGRITSNLAEVIHTQSIFIIYS